MTAPATQPSGPSPRTPAEAASLLPALARNAVAERLGLGERLDLADRPWLDQLAATFVTITRRERGELHGCIGTIEAHRPLREDVEHNAQMAAFRDPRSRPLRADELAQVHFSVSLLGPRSPVTFVNQAHARAALRPGVDGLVLHWHGHRGVFLPQVWDSLPEPRDFLDQLKRKAGLPADFWARDLTLERFEVDKFAEPDPPPHA